MLLVSADKLQTSMQLIVGPRCQISNTFCHSQNSKQSSDFLLNLVLLTDCNTLWDFIRIILIPGHRENEQSNSYTYFLGQNICTERSKTIYPIVNGFWELKTLPNGHSW